MINRTILQENITILNVRHLDIECQNMLCKGWKKLQGEIDECSIILETKQRLKSDCPGIKVCMWLDFTGQSTWEERPADGEKYGDLYSILLEDSAAHSAYTWGNVLNWGKEPSPKNRRNSIWNFQDPRDGACSYHSNLIG